MMKTRSWFREVTRTLSGGMEVVGSDQVGLIHHVSAVGVKYAEVCRGLVHRRDPREVEVRPPRECCIEEREGVQQLAVASEPVQRVLVDPHFSVEGQSRSFEAIRLDPRLGHHQHLVLRREIDLVVGSHPPQPAHGSCRARCEP